MNIRGVKMIFEFSFSKQILELKKSFKKYFSN